VANHATLSALHDIHVPHAIGWWPCALGWYLLALMVLMTIGAGIWGIKRYFQRNRAKRQALELLQTYQDDYQLHDNSATSAALISELLKRVALAYYPRTHVAHLHGDAWIRFLNETATDISFNPVREQLLETPYKPQDKQSMAPLFKLARQWIKQQGKLCLN
jgi:hypothetical protein